MIADFDEDRAAVAEHVCGAGGGAAVEIQTVRTVGERLARFEVTNARGQIRHGVGGDVRRVGDEDVKPLWRDGVRRKREPVRDGGLKPIADAESSGVLLSDEGGCGADVDADAGRCGHVLEDADDDAAAADAEFEDPWVGVGGAGTVIENGFDEEFRLRSGDEDVGGDMKFEGEELALAGQVGDRLGRRRAFNQFAEAGSLVVVGDAVKPGVKLNASALEYVGEEDFGAEAGVVHPFFGEEIAGRGEKALHGPRRGEIGRRRH